MKPGGNSDAGMSNNPSVPSFMGDLGHQRRQQQLEGECILKIAKRVHNWHDCKPSLSNVLAIAFAFACVVPKLDVHKSMRAPMMLHVHTCEQCHQQKRDDHDGAHLSPLHTSDVAGGMSHIACPGSGGVSSSDHRHVPPELVYGPRQQRNVTAHGATQVHEQA